MEKDYQKNVMLLKALADATRLEIIDMLADGELCACKILESFHITQPTLSYHMKILTDCGLVNATRRGPWMRYTINPEVMDEIKNMFADFEINQNETEQCGCHKGGHNGANGGCHKLQREESNNRYQEVILK